MARLRQNPLREKLLGALKKIDRPGSFCASGTAPPVLPGLEMGGVGTISLPLTAAQADELKSKCEQAGYGKGEQTLVDTNVRRVWKLSPSKFSLTNSAWNNVLDEIVSKVQSELGLEGQALTAHLYDLLLYEKGGFFLPHRDGERLDRMVATLIICLPSSYTGGELVVRHEGHEQVIDFSGEEGNYQTHYAAFYADCEHEVRPVRSGFRLCLVYNLTLAKSKSRLGAPTRAEHVAKLAEILRQGSAHPTEVEKTVVTLTHQYSQSGLKWDSLKGVDRSRAVALAEAARLAGWHAYLAQLTLWESGSIAYDGEYEYGYGRRSRSSAREPDEYVFEEMLDTSLTAEHWQDPNGEPMPFGTLKVQPGEIVPEDSLKAIAPQQDVQGYTGNEGLTMDRWYRHAVIALWPDERHFDVLCDDDSRNAVPLLLKMVSALGTADSTEAQSGRERCLTFARKILERWPEKADRYRDGSVHGWSGSTPRFSPESTDPLPAIDRLDDLALLQLYLRSAVTLDVTLEPSKELPHAISRQGWDMLRADLATIFKATTPDSIERDARLLERLCLAASRIKKAAGGAEAFKTCRLLSELILAALIRIDTSKSPHDYRAREINRAELLARLAQSFMDAGLEDLLEQLQAHIAATSSLYPLHAVQLPALAELRKWLQDHRHPASPAVSRWIERCIAELESLTSAAPQPPADFRREASVRCACKFCKELNQFLSDPNAGEHRFPTAQVNRRHLEMKIRYSHCDLTCKTDKRPRPQVLICIKTIESFDRRKKEYEDNLKHLKALGQFREECRVHAASYSK